MDHRKGLVEAEFLIPIRGDRGLCSGDAHAPHQWTWMHERLVLDFGAYTRAPGFHHGIYRDSDTGRMVEDRSRKYIVALPRKSLNKLRGLLKEACVQFAQKCLYLSVAGCVEFVNRPSP